METGRDGLHSKQLTTAVAFWQRSQSGGGNMSLTNPITTAIVSVVVTFALQTEEGEVHLLWGDHVALLV